jgi:hypothetical protein
MTSLPASQLGPSKCCTNTKPILNIILSMPLPNDDPWMDMPPPVQHKAKADKTETQKTKDIMKLRINL